MDMKKVIALVVWCVALALPGVAQDMKVEKFELLDKDMTANTHGSEKRDQNGQRAALIKIVTRERGFTFNGGSLGIAHVDETHDGEVWVYVPRNAKRLTISHQTFGVLRDYAYPVAIEGGRTYMMLLDLGNGRYVTVNSSNANSTIYIDGEDCGPSPVNYRYLTYGTHKARAVKDRFEGEQEFTVTANDKDESFIVHVEQRDMSDHFGDVTVTVDNNADIYFNDKRVGTGRWQDQLREGTYTVETRKADCDPVQTTFTVVAQQQNDVKANAPTPHTGWLSVFIRPNNVTTTPYDLSEPLTLPVGTHGFDFSRKGYVSQHHEYAIRHNEMTRDTVTLERVKYVKPLAFYFGGGYAVRSLGGITALLGAVFHNHDVQAHYTFGLSASDPVHAYSADGNDNYLSTLSYTQSSFGLKYGYQFNLMRQLAITPQVGFAVDRLSGSVDNGSGLYADGAAANNLTLGVKLLLVPFQHCYIFAAPEFDVAVSKDENYQRLAELSNVTAGGFMATVGLIVNF